MIEADEELTYDNITSSYNLNLPVDYYYQHLKRCLPSSNQQQPTQQRTPNNDKEDWFIRPHHIESVTGHKNSVKDDVLNTRYFSLYNRDYGKEFGPKPNELALEHIRSMVDQLKAR